MGAFLLQRVLGLYGIGLILAATLTYLAPALGILALGGAVPAALLFAALFPIGVERSAMAFRRLRPRYCSIYEPYYWRHERLWKLSRISLLGLFDGTPFKSVLWRLGGVRMGRKVFDDGMIVPEKTLVTIGDHATLNAGVIIQCHSLEDATFTSDTAAVGDGVTLGPNAFVHYGTRLGDRVVVDADSFVMKGSQAAPDSRWRGNPATEVPDDQPLDRPVAEVLALPRSAPGVVRQHRLTAIAAAAAAVTGIAALAGMAAAALRRPMTAAEGPLADGTFAAVRGLTPPATGSGDWATRMHLTGYTQLTGAFDRHADLLLGARELTVVAAAATVVALVLATRRHPLLLAGLAAVFALIATAPPVASGVAALGPSRSD